MNFLKYINYDININYNDNQYLALKLIFYNLMYFNQNNKTNIRVVLDNDEFYFHTTEDFFIDFIILTIKSFSLEEITEDNAYEDITFKISHIIKQTKDLTTLIPMFSNFTFYLGDSERTKKFKWEISNFL